MAEDKRKNNGGARQGAGRKPKADEERARKLSENAIIEVYGSIEKYWHHIAKESKESVHHLKIIHEYAFGKPTENVNNNIIMDKPARVKFFKSGK